MPREAGSAWRSHQSTIDAARRRNPNLARRSCAGTLRVEDDDGRRPFSVRCDECGELAGVAQEGKGPRRPEPRQEEIAAPQREFEAGF
jgi:hypothetical protein